MLNILIYNPNSFGGNYEYSLRLLKAYHAIEGISCELILPNNSIAVSKNEILLLLSDQLVIQNNILKKIYFVLRSVLNPMILLYYIIKKGDVKLLIFNDFDQITAPFWSPLYRILLQKVIRVVILHDPDRDKYLPYEFLSRITMKAVMKVMHIGLYHEILPSKSYYINVNAVYQEVPHGIYDLKDESCPKLEQNLCHFKKNRKLICILGNVREEKNYKLIISSLAHLPDVCLLIAGKPASSSVNIDEYMRYATQMKVGDRVHWIIKYLDEGEMRTIINTSDIISLYYKSSFASQSGLLNVIAQFHKRVLVADTPNALSNIVRTFSIAPLIKADDEAAFVKGVKDVLEEDLVQLTKSWNAYLSYASWSNHVSVVLETVNKYESKTFGRGVA